MSSGVAHCAKPWSRHVVASRGQEAKRASPLTSSCSHGQRYPVSSCRPPVRGDSRPCGNPGAGQRLWDPSSIADRTTALVVSGGIALLRLVWELRVLGVVVNLHALHVWRTLSAHWAPKSARGRPRVQKSGRQTCRGEARRVPPGREGAGRSAHLAWPAAPPFRSASPAFPPPRLTVASCAFFLSSACKSAGTNLVSQRRQLPVDPFSAHAAKFPQVQITKQTHRGVVCWLSLAHCRSVRRAGAQVQSTGAKPPQRSFSDEGVRLEQRRCKKLLVVDSGRAVFGDRPGRRRD